VLCAFIVYPFLATCQAHHNLLDCTLTSLHITELLVVSHFTLRMAVILFLGLLLVGECILILLVVSHFTLRMAVILFLGLLLVGECILMHL